MARWGQPRWSSHRYAHCSQAEKDRPLVGDSRSPGEVLTANELDEPAAPLTARVVRAGAWSLGSQVATLAASLVATPFVIRALGTEGYGAFAFLQLMLSYLAISELGMGGAASRFASSARASSSPRTESNIVFTSLAIAIGPALLMAALIVIASEPIALSLLGSGELRDDVATALRLAAVILTARAVANVLSAPQFARLRLDVNALVAGGTSVAQIALVPIALVFIPSVSTAIAVMAAVSLVAVVLHAVASWRIAPASMRIGFDAQMVRPLAGYGAATGGMILVGVALAHSEKLILAQLAGVAALAYLSIAYTIARLTAILPGALAPALLPAFARLHASGEIEAARALYGRAARYLFVLLAPGALILCVVGAPFLRVWAGPEFERESFVPLCILAGAAVIDGLSYVPRVYLSAIGRPQRILRYQLVSLPFYILLAIALVIPFAAVGAAIAWSLRATAEAGLLARAVARLGPSEAVPVRIRWAAVLASMGALVLPSGAAALLGAGLTTVALLAVLGGAAYAVIVSRTLIDLAEARRLLDLLRSPILDRRMT